MALRHIGGRHLRIVFDSDLAAEIFCKIVGEAIQGFLRIAADKIVAGAVRWTNAQERVHECVVNGALQAVALAKTVIVGALLPYSAAPGQAEVVCSGRCDGLPVDFDFLDTRCIQQQHVYVLRAYLHSSGRPGARGVHLGALVMPVSYTHLTLPTIYSV